MAAAVVVSVLPSCAEAQESNTDEPSAESAPIGARSTLRDPSFTYQPDVVFVGTDGEAVLGASADGLMWTVAGDAAGADDLTVGVVMYASKEAVGRVVQISPAGPDLDVTLAPVEITDVLRDAEIDIDVAVDADSVQFQEIPELPGSVPAPLDASDAIEVGGGDGPRAAGPLTGQPADPRQGVPTTDNSAAPVVSVEGFRSAAHRADAGTPASPDPLPTKTKVGGKVAVGDWEVEPLVGRREIGLRVGYKAASDKGIPGDGVLDSALKIFFDVAFKTSNPRIRSTVSIVDGKVQPGLTAVLEGITAIRLDVAAGAASAGSAAKGSARVEVPVELTVPIAGPFLIRVRWTFGVKFVPGGANSTITAAGEWALDGAIGLEHGGLLVPKLSTVKSVIDSVTGLSVGVAGIIVAAEMRVQLGFGIPAAAVGPYVRMVVDVGIVNGSSISGSIPRCVGVTRDLWLGYGVGASLKSEATAALERLLPAKTKIDLTIYDALTNIDHAEQTLPDAALCVGES